jgi:hypothetical protein
MKKLAIIAGVVAITLGGISYANHLVTQEVKVEVDRQLAMLTEQVGSVISYDELSTSVFSQSVELSNLVVTGFDGQSIAAIDGISVAGYETDKIAPRTEISVNGFKFSDEFVAQLPPDANNQLASARYDLHTLMNYDANTGNNDIALSINANDIVVFHFDLGLANSTPLMEASLAASKLQQESGSSALTLEQQLQQQTVMMDALSKLEPRNISIKLNNEGKLQAIVEHMLSEQGMTIDQMQQMVEMQLQQSPVSDELAQAIKDFTQGFGSLTVSARLPQGKTMAEINQQIFALMGKPNELAEFINLKAKGD